MSLNEKGSGELWMLLVEHDDQDGFALCHWLRRQSVMAVLASSANEALTILRDADLLDSAFDALLLDFQLPDGSAYRVVSAFRDEFPGRPAAILTEQEDVCLRLWSRSRGIPLIRKPYAMEELGDWLRQIHASPRHVRTKRERALLTNS